MKKTYKCRGSSDARALLYQKLRNLVRRSGGLASREEKREGGGEAGRRRTRESRAVSVARRDERRAVRAASGLS